VPAGQRRRCGRRARGGRGCGSPSTPPPTPGPMPSAHPAAGTSITIRAAATAPARPSRAGAGRTRSPTEQHRTPTESPARVGGRAEYPVRVLRWKSCSRTRRHPDRRLLARPKPSRQSRYVIGPAILAELSGSSTGNSAADVQIAER
jgi:hypothetical protein